MKLFWGFHATDSAIACTIWDPLWIWIDLRRTRKYANAGSEHCPRMQGSITITWNSWINNDDKVSRLLIYKCFKDLNSTSVVFNMIWSLIVRWHWKNKAFNPLDIVRDYKCGNQLRLLKVGLSEASECAPLKIIHGLWALKSFWRFTMASWELDLIRTLRNGTSNWICTRLTFFIKLSHVTLLQSVLL